MRCNRAGSSANVAEEPAMRIYQVRYPSFVRYFLRKVTPILLVRKKKCGRKYVESPSLVARNFSDEDLPPKCQRKRHAHHPQQCGRIRSNYTSLGCSQKMRAKLFEITLPFVSLLCEQLCKLRRSCSSAACADERVLITLHLRSQNLPVDTICRSFTSAKFADEHAM